MSGILSSAVVTRLAGLVGIVRRKKNPPKSRDRRTEPPSFAVENLEGKTLMSGAVDATAAAIFVNLNHAATKKPVLLQNGERARVWRVDVSGYDQPPTFNVRSFGRGSKFAIDVKGGVAYFNVHQDGAHQRTIGFGTYGSVFKGFAGTGNSSFFLANNWGRVDIDGRNAKSLNTKVVSAESFNYKGAIGADVVDTNAEQAIIQGMAGKSLKVFARQNTNHIEVYTTNFRGDSFGGSVNADVDLRRVRANAPDTFVSGSRNATGFIRARDVTLVPTLAAAKKLKIVAAHVYFKT